MKLDEKIVLHLNRNWQVIGYRSIRESITAMNSAPGGADKAALGVDVTYDVNGKASYNPLPWEEWLKLPIREGDKVIHTPRLAIRVPTIIIAINFAKVILREPKLSKAAILERDGYICQYSGKKLFRSQLDIDHPHPKSRGGKDSWENMVACDKKINRKKKDKFPHEAGLKLIKDPKKPLAKPIAAIVPLKHKDWKPFLINK